MAKKIPNEKVEDIAVLLKKHVMTLPEDQRIDWLCQAAAGHHACATTASRVSENWRLAYWRMRKYRVSESLIMAWRHFALCLSRLTSQKVKYGK